MTIDAPGAPRTIASGVNNAGVVVGSYQSGDYFVGFRWYQGTLQTIAIPGNYQTELHGINNVGQIVGGYFAEDDPSHTHGLIYDSGVFTTLDFPGASQTLLYGINDSGQIVGFFVNGATSGGFLYSGGTFSTIIDVMPVTISLGLNNNTQIVGTDSDTIGWIYIDGSFSYIPIPGGTNTFLQDAFGINNDGTIVGDAMNPSGDYDGYIIAPGVSSQLLNYPSATNTRPNGINDNGFIVGQYFGPSTGHEAHHGFLAVPIAFAGMPGRPNCHGKSVSALARQYGGLDAAAAALGFSSVSVLQNAISAFCAG
jgi:uncharacterized membrane protein